MDELERWYTSLTYTEAKDILQEKLDNMKKDFIAAGYYLKYIRDNKQYLEDGYATIWEFAEDNYGIKKSTASRWMSMNCKFSQDGNSPILAEEYKEFGKSQLQEMLYLEDTQIEEVTPDMTVKEIREIRTPATEPEEYEIPKEHLGQCIHREEYICTLSEASKLAVGDGIDCNQKCCWNCTKHGDCAYECNSSSHRPDNFERISTEPFAISQQSTTEDVAEIDHFVANNQSINYAYGATRSKIVHEYLMTGYKDSAKECEIEAFGSTYKVLKRNAVTVFYSSSGKTLFDVENERLEKEYQFFTRGSNVSENLSEENIPVNDTSQSVPEEVELNEFYEEPENLEDIITPFSEELQLEMPTLKNNEQRKEFIDGYQAWPVWIETKETGEKYYKHDLPDGNSFVVKVYYHRCFDFTINTGNIEERYHDGWGGEEYYLLKEGKHFRDCLTNRSWLVQHLKEMQKGKA